MRRLLPRERYTPHRLHERSLDHDDLTFEQVTAKMQTAHLDMVRIVEAEMEQAHLPEVALAPIRAHKKQAVEKGGAWFNDAGNTKQETNDALNAKLQGCMKVLTGGDHVTRDGDKVEAQFKGSTNYYPGEIRADNRDGTYDVAFDDGDRDRMVPERSIR